MEFTYQSTMQLPASYAVLSEDEMVYTVGGAFELNIDRAAVAQFGYQCDFKQHPSCRTVYFSDGF